MKVSIEEAFFSVHSHCLVTEGHSKTDVDSQVVLSITQGGSFKNRWSAHKSNNKFTHLRRVRDTPSPRASWTEHLCTILSIESIYVESATLNQRNELLKGWRGGINSIVRTKFRTIHYCGLSQISFVCYNTHSLLNIPHLNIPLVTGLMISLYFYFSVLRPHDQLSILLIYQLLLTRFWPNFNGRFLGTSRIDSNC